MEIFLGAIFLLVVTGIVVFLLGLIVWGGISNLKNNKKQKAFLASTETTKGEWQICFGDEEQDPEQFEVKNFANQTNIWTAVHQYVTSRNIGALTAWEDTGTEKPHSFWDRLLPANKMRMHLCLEWNGDLAVLVFFDGEANEYHSIDLETAATEPLDQESTIPQERALLAISQYLPASKRPDWLNYSQRG